MSSIVRGYERLPRPAQHLAVSTQGLLNRRRRLGPGFRRHLAAYEATGSGTESMLEAQRARLDRTLAQASADAPALAGLDAADLAGWPITTKDQVLADPGAYLMVPEGPTRAVATGGSTGTPLRFLTTQDAIEQQWAVWWRYRRWHGISLDTWCGYFGGKRVCPTREASHFWRYNLGGRQVQFSTLHLDAETVGRFVAEIDRRRLSWLHGLPSTLGLLASLMAEQGLAPAHPLRWVTFGSENVPAGTPAIVESVFGVAPRQHYGQAEGVANFSECPDGRLHVDEDYAHVEFLPYEADVGSERLFRVVGTSFTNTAQALVRYDTTDLVSGLEDGCSCGRPGRVVGRIDGRTASYATLADGRRVGPISHVFRGLAGIVQAQVFALPHGGLVVHLVAGRGYDAAVESEIRRRVLERVDGDLSVRVEVRAALVRGANGKVPVVISGTPPP